MSDRLREEVQRWQCTSCERYLSDEQVETIEVPPGDFDPNPIFGGIWGPARYRQHRAHTPRGAGYSCGPVEQVRVSAQERFVEWLGTLKELNRE